MENGGKYGMSSKVGTKIKTIKNVGFATILLYECCSRILFNDGNPPSIFCTIFPESFGSDFYSGQNDNHVLYQIDHHVVLIMLQIIGGMINLKMPSSLMLRITSQRIPVCWVLLYLKWPRSL